MPRKVIWPKIKKVWWCYTCNIPILQNICPRCSNKAKRLLLSDPGDVRPAFEKDYKWLYQAYLYEFGTSVGFNDLIGKSIVLLNKAPYYDEMKEVVVDGVQIGRLFFDPLLRRWRFRLSKYSAIKLYTSYPAIFDVVKLNKKHYVHADIIRIDRDIAPSKQILLLDSTGNIAGIGYSKGKGRIMVHTWWRAQTTDRSILIEDAKKSDLSDVINAHKEHIYILSSQAKKFISITYEKINKPILASFSGGKDSLVSLHLLLDLGLDPIIIFNNTGIELPETISTVYKTIDKYGLKLIEASAGERFWDTVYKLGIPGRDYRWCCKICKLAPLALLVKNMWSNGGINIVGQRAFESIDRARSPRLWRLRWAPTLLNLSPIIEWSQFEVWLYIIMYSLDVNPLYYMGYERIGCFMCPASTIAELDLVSRTHRELWSRWLNVLNYWAKRLNMPNEWIEYGLWRWNAPVRYRSIIAKRLGIDKRVDNWLPIFKSMANPGIEMIEKSSEKIRIVLNKNIDIRCILDQITILNPIDYLIDSAKETLEINWGHTISIISNKTIDVYINSSESMEKVIDILKTIYRWHLCTMCRSCEAICPSNAVLVNRDTENNNKLLIDKSKCISCKFCLYNCPVAEVYVEHVIAPIVFNNPEAWKRESREHHLEILEKIKKYVVNNISTSNISKPISTPQDSFIDISMFFQRE